MLAKIHTILDYLLGLTLSADVLTTFHFINRMMIIYILGIALVRMQRQFMGINTPFNYIITFVLGSVLASAVIGDAPYMPVLTMTLFILIINFVMAALVYYSKFFEKIIRGERDVLVKDGKIQWDNMRRNLVTYDELMESAHSCTIEELNEIKKAYFENSGKITIIIKK